MTDTIKKSRQVIGEFVRARRQANNLTQQELGELAGVGTRFISELERGKLTLRMDAVNRVLRVFGQMLAHIEAPKDEAPRDEAPRDGGTGIYHKKWLGIVTGVIGLAIAGLGARIVMGF